MSQHDKKVAFITGATSGIGAAFARRLAADGYGLILTGRRRELLETLAQELQRNHHVTVETILAELSDPAEVDKLARLMRERTIDMLINNAGFGMQGRFYEADATREEQMVLVHVLCSLRLTRSALPGMIARGHGAIINVSSLAAFIPMPMNVTYSATKAFLKLFSQSLHIELMGTGVRVQALCPGLTRTDFHGRSGLADDRWLNSRFFTWLTAEKVVGVSLNCLRKNKVVCVPGFWNRMLLRGIYWMPTSIYNRIARWVLIDDRTETSNA